MTDNKYLTVREVAKIFRRHPATIRKWIAEGRLQALKIMNSGYLIPEAEILKLKNESED